MTNKFLLLLIALLLPLGGCEMSCRADDNNSIEDAVDEVGDEIEDVVEEVKDDDV